ncbi:MAG TPA: trehalase family glycosidase [bacterium]|nr:trehalase family glycosidase [bacterium]HPG46808.1 trehalase family glycosidase [bacterium]HPM98862.1 trehalase family glycosidase [bacterium]
MKRWFLIDLLVLGFLSLYAEPIAQIRDSYLQIDATANDPLFTTYAAAMERSRFFADKAYFMDYFSPEKPITYSSQFAGEFTVIWKINNVVFSRIRDFYKAPVVTASFPDMAVLNYEPFQDVRVNETFLVYSSAAAVIDLEITNAANRAFAVVLYPLLFKNEEAFVLADFDSATGRTVAEHHEPLERLHSNLYATRGYPTDFRDMLACSERPDSFGGFVGCDLQQFYFAAKRLSKVHENVLHLNEIEKGKVNFIALHKNIDLQPGMTVRIRFVRGVQDEQKPPSELVQDVDAALLTPLQKHLDANADLFRSVPRLNLSRQDKMVYLGAFNLVRQCMLPPSGKTRYNFYVFSREPQWGWGHGHQVMHESLSMLPYVYLDPQSAMDSQRIYMEQQYADGLIGYRHGPRGPQVYPHEGKATTSAPFFTWTNWEIYRVAGDKEFLNEAYRSGAAFVGYLQRERDDDRDGLFEWGPYGIIENVRDGWNVVFQLFSDGEDEGRDISAELEALDLSVQVANEMFYLEKMATELGDKQGADHWRREHQKLAELINQTLWDPEDEFYYHTAQSDNTFLFEGESLKRKEIIGFLPLWARVAPPDRAEKLLRHLLNPNSFWRTYGVPTLAADDPHYTPFVDGCCRWNGPIWLLWDYMVLQGLDFYGYETEKRQLADKMMLAVKSQLSTNHRFWESFSPDYPVLECPSNYIWDSIIAKVLIDVYGE